MSDQGAPAESGPAPEAPQQETGPPEWLSPITDKLDELGMTTSQLAEQYAALQQQPEYEEAEQEGDEGFELYDDDGDLTPEAAQAIIDARVDERLSSVLGERDAMTAIEHREDAFEALRDEIPALQDDQLAARIVNEVAQWCRQTGNEHLIDRPEFVELVEDRFYREQYQERLASEQEAEGPQVVLESASGAAPKQSNEPDWGKRVLDAAQRLNPEI